MSTPWLRRPRVIGPARLASSALLVVTTGVLTLQHAGAAASVYDDKNCGHIQARRARSTGFASPMGRRRSARPVVRHCREMKTVHTVRDAINRLRRRHETRLVVVSIGAVKGDRHCEGCRHASVGSRTSLTTMPLIAQLTTWYSLVCSLPRWLARRAVVGAARSSTDTYTFATGLLDLPRGVASVTPKPPSSAWFRREMTKPACRARFTVRLRLCLPSFHVTLILAAMVVGLGRIAAACRRPPAGYASVARLRSSISVFAWMKASAGADMRVHADCLTRPAAVTLGGHHGHGFGELVNNIFVVFDVVLIGVPRAEWSEPSATQPSPRVDPAGVNGQVVEHSKVARVGSRHAELRSSARRRSYRYADAGGTAPGLVHDDLVGSPFDGESISASDLLLQHEPAVNNADQDEHAGFGVTMRVDFLAQQLQADVGDGVGWNAWDGAHTLRR